VSIRVRTGALVGIGADEIWVEAHETGRKDGVFGILGLSDASAKESRERVRAALHQVGIKYYGKKGWLVNLAPAGVRKEGAGFDLAIAVSLMVAMGRVPKDLVLGSAFFGELSLDGTVLPIRGIVALVIAAKEAGVDRVFLPHACAPEAAQVGGVDIIPIRYLRNLQSLLAGQLSDEDVFDPGLRQEEFQSLGCQPNFSEVLGQRRARRAVEVAAAGGHNLLMIGQPGCGKSMIAERLPSILPSLNEAEALESMRIHSVAGLNLSNLLRKERPFRSPHHTVSTAGLIGGTAIPRPGEISLAHNGVLFLDEFPEFKRCSLEALRSPLESGAVQVTRAQATFQFPARFQLIAAMNPCPCGRLGSDKDPCQCSQVSIEKYLSRLSRPILDRIDIHLELDPVPLSVVTAREPQAGEASTAIRERVIKARDIQISRQGVTNAALASSNLAREVRLSAKATALLEKGAELRGLSARGVVRVIKIARTISDLAELSDTNEEAIAEALSYRSLERLQRSVGKGG
jgi:magnesium chelatase family protein